MRSTRSFAAAWLKTGPSSALIEALIVSCEHAGNRIPTEYSTLFAGYETILASHRGWDPGALIFAQDLAKELKTPLFSSEYSRLLVDLNRSRHHRALFSTVTGNCSARIRKQIIDGYYNPYRSRVENAIAEALDTCGYAWHISCHSFTPVLDGEIRRADLGILYDPARAREKEFAHDLRSLLRSKTDLRIRLNYPYRGTADGLTSHLRRRFGAAYAGIEIELNQAYAAEDPAEWETLRRSFAFAIRESL